MDLAQSSVETRRLLLRSINSEWEYEISFTPQTIHNQKWLGETPLQIARAALELLVTARQHAKRMLNYQAL
jgi:hypothetical protein